MARIFLSYRRDDSGGYAGRLYDRLSQHFGHDHLFIDVDNIPLGHDFVEVIQNEVGSCDVLLAVIGRQWLTSTDPRGDRRLDNPEDFVRLEITTALERRIRIIPVLVGGASMPRSTELPDVLQPLARRQALVVGDRFHPDVDRLIAALEPVLSTAPSTREQVAEPSMVSSGTPPRDPSPSTPPPAPPKALEPSFTNSLGMEFMLIPPGTFLMGSPDSDVSNPTAFANETPAHHVTISQPFYLGQYQVTQAQWKALMGNNPSQFTSNPDRPVDSVSWDDVQMFIKQLNEREGLLYRLPTEAEWEYAARAGTTTAYCFGDDRRRLGEYAWYKENAGAQTHPVGTQQPNAWGLYDMHGNVWEWVQDWYGDYAPEPVTDPQGPTSGSFRVFRGGSWNLVAWCCRSAFRHFDARGIRYGDLGFRLLRTAP